MIADSVLDAPLNKIATATVIHLTKAAYTTRQDVIDNSAASYTPSFTAVSDAAGGGRQITKEAGSDASAEANADIANGGGYRYYLDGSEILFREPCTGASIGDGGQVNDGASTITFRDPTFS